MAHCAVIRRFVSIWRRGLPLQRPDIPHHKHQNPSEGVEDAIDREFNDLFDQWRKLTNEILSEPTERYEIGESVLLGKAISYPAQVNSVIGVYLQNNRSILNVFERFFPGFRLGHPNREIQFEGCTTKKFMFREWDFSSIDHGEVTLVFWPQHPSRPPFTNFEIWKAACHEFEERHRNTARLKE